MSTPEVIDTTGRQVRLTSIIGKGGEGTVYGIGSSNDFVAKIYHQPLTSDRAAKIQIMSAFSDPTVKQLSAWPVALLLSKATRAPVGLVIPKVVNGKDVHKLYSPKSRQSEFQKADWRFLVLASSNIARSFNAIHKAECVIGDVNEGSVLVAENATVKLIDCDSFQLVSNGKRYACEVGVETFTPPELQGRNLREVFRTPNHDNFGLAVMIFLLLFMGRHPFAGRYLGRGDMPIPKAISELRFAYSAMRADVQMDKPPGTPPLSIVGDEVAFLFERAFAKQMVQGGRPQPAEWVKALSSLHDSLRECSANPSHWHLRGTTCPWCPMEAITGVDLFPFVGARGFTPADLTSLWRQIEALHSPGAPPPIQAPQPQPSAEALELASSYSRANILAFVLALLVGALAVFGDFKAPAPFFLLFAATLTFFGARKWLDKSNDVYKLREARNRAEKSWAQAQGAWNERAGSKVFDDKKQDVLRLRQSIDQLPSLRASKLDALKKTLRQAQLERFLDGFEIEDAKLDGIGSGRKRTLESYGIETAADLLTNKLESVPGFGPVLRGTLYSWRKSLESRFKFNPATGIDPKSIAKLDQEIQKERLRLEQSVRSGLSELQQAHHRIVTARDQLRTPVQTAYAEFLRADVNYRTASGG